jgi:polar amino acid transport system substrate-binding protein
MKYLLHVALLSLFCGTVLARDEVVVIATVEGLADVAAGQAVVREAYHRIGKDVEFRRFPAAAALSNSSAGLVDAELQRIDGISARYPDLVQIPIPINLTQAVAYSRKYRFPVSGWHSLRPYRIGIVEGILFAEVATSGMEVQTYASYADLVDGLWNDEVEVGVMSRIEGRAILSAADRDGIAEMDGILETQFLYHYVHRSRRPLVDQLQPVLKAMLLHGETRRIYEQALADAERQP